MSYTGCENFGMFYYYKGNEDINILNVEIGNKYFLEKWTEILYLIYNENNEYCDYFDIDYLNDCFISIQERRKKIIEDID